MLVSIKLMSDER